MHSPGNLSTLGTIQEEQAANALARFDVLPHVKTHDLKQRLQIGALRSVGSPFSSIEKLSKIMIIYTGIIIIKYNIYRYFFQYSNRPGGKIISWDLICMRWTHKETFEGFFVWADFHLLRVQVLGVKKLALMQ